MKQPLRVLIGTFAAVLLSQCSGSDSGKKTSPAEMSLSQRAMLKPNEQQRSQFEKYLTGGKGMKTGTGAWYQKQMHHSKGYGGTNSFAGQKQFKTGQSTFGKSKTPGMDMTYALGDRQSSMAGDGFKTGLSKYGSQRSHDSGSSFSGADSIFKTGSALTRSRGAPKAPHIIENINATSAKNSVYSEDDVKRLLGR